MLMVLPLMRLVTLTQLLCCIISILVWQRPPVAHALVSEQCELESDLFSDSTELREAFGLITPETKCTGNEEEQEFEACTHDYTKQSVTNYIGVCQQLGGKFFRADIVTNCTEYDGSTIQSTYQSDPYCFGKCSEGELEELFQEAFKEDNCEVLHMQVTATSAAEAAMRQTMMLVATTVATSMLYSCL